jgi:hypothetical protein
MPNRADCNIHEDMDATRRILCNILMGDRVLQSLGIPVINAGPTGIEHISQNGHYIGPFWAGRRL